MPISASVDPTERSMPGGEHDERHPDRYDEEDRDAREEVLDVRPGEEVLLGQRENDEDRHEEDQHRGVSTRRRPRARGMIENPLSPRVDVRSDPSLVPSGEVSDAGLGRFFARKPSDDPSL